MIDARALIGKANILFITFDSLRLDVAQLALEKGLTPNLAEILPNKRWETRHTPANFTYPAHHAFFTGFLPTPISPKRHLRLFASRFAGSQTISKKTFLFDEATLPEALAARGYHTACIGGVAFFNLRSKLGSVLPNLFQEKHWHPSFGVTSHCSTKNQVTCAVNILKSLPSSKLIFLFINISATHKPSSIFLAGTEKDSIETQIAALAYADSQLPLLFEALADRGPCLAILCSDHGTTFGEGGFEGHRIAHPTIWSVPYAELKYIRD